MKEKRRREIRYFFLGKLISKIQLKIKDIRTAVSISLLSFLSCLMRYLIATSILIILFNFTVLHIETTLVENAVEKFNLQQQKVIDTFSSDNIYDIQSIPEHPYNLS